MEVHLGTVFPEQVLGCTWGWCFLSEERGPLRGRVLSEVHLWDLELWRCWGTRVEGAEGKCFRAGICPQRGRQCPSGSWPSHGVSCQGCRPCP